MRGLPALMILVLFALSALMIAVGLDNTNEAGWLPVVVGCLWGLFAIGALFGRLAPSR